MRNLKKPKPNKEVSPTSTRGQKIDKRGRKRRIDNYIGKDVAFAQAASGVDEAHQSPEDLKREKREFRIQLIRKALHEARLRREGVPEDTIRRDKAFTEEPKRVDDLPTSHVDCRLCSIRWGKFDRPEDQMRILRELEDIQDWICSMRKYTNFTTPDGLAPED